MNENEKLNVIDILSILSFLIGLENLNINATQTDMQNIQAELNKKTDLLLNEIHSHLEKQDKALEQIAERLNK